MRYTAWAALKELYWLGSDTLADLRMGEKLALGSRLRAYWKVVSGQVDPDAPLELQPSAQAIRLLPEEMALESTKPAAGVTAVASSSPGGGFEYVEISGQWYKIMPAEPQHTT